jgi:hypothetical protein
MSALSEKAGTAEEPQVSAVFMLTVLNFEIIH